MGSKNTTLHLLAIVTLWILNFSVLQFFYLENGDHQKYGSWSC